MEETSKMELELLDEKGELSVNVSYILAKWEKQIKEIETKQEEIRKLILNEMETRGIDKFDNQFITITYVKPTTRSTFDSKQFAADHTDLYEAYKKPSDVKASIRIKVK